MSAAAWVYQRAMEQGMAARLSALAPGELSDWQGARRIGLVVARREDRRDEPFEQCGGGEESQACCG